MHLKKLIGLTIVSSTIIVGNSFAVVSSQYADQSIVSLGSEKEGETDALRGQKSTELANESISTDTNISISAYGGNGSYNSGIRIRGNSNRAIRAVNSSITDNVNFNVKGKNANVNSGVDYEE